MKRSHLALILVLAVSGVASAHNGVTGFIPTIPDPNAMVIDGSEDDWAWIDPDFIIAPEDIEAQSGDGTGLGGNGIPDDWSASYRMGWSPPPDNSLYLFARVIDDTLGAAESEVKRNWWNDDSLEFNMDMDHSGGPMSWTSTEEVYNGYRINIHPLFDSQLGGTIAIDLQEPGLEDWGALPPYCTTGGHSPAGGRRPPVVQRRIHVRDEDLTPVPALRHPRPRRQHPARVRTRSGDRAAHPVDGSR